MVRLTGYGDRKPAELSGGQRQRVALARSIVNRPRVLLLDEPLGALDLKLREQMQVELKQIQGEVGITFVYVTHDQEEALTMSDRIAVFNEGRIEQVGHARPRSTRRPANPFVSGFVGVSNVLERDGRAFTVRPEKVRLLEPGEPADGLQTESGPRPRRRLRGDDHPLPGRRSTPGESFKSSARTSRRPQLRRSGRSGGRWSSDGGRNTRSRSRPRAREENSDANQETASPARVAWLVIAGLLVFMVAFAAGCGSDDERRFGDHGRERWPDRARRGRGRGQPDRLGRLRRGRLDRPGGRLGDRLREGDRLPGQRQGRQHVGRDGAADAHRRVRRRLGVR